MGKLEFAAWWGKIRTRYFEILIVESKERPICFVGAYFDGWKYEPHVEFFSCATKREKLIGSVEFFKRLKESEVGVVIVKSLDESKNLFDRICKYDCLEYVGSVIKGDCRGTEHIYSAAGNAKFPSATSPTAGWV